MQEKDSQEIVKTLDRAGAGISASKRLLAKHLIFPLLNKTVSWQKAWDIYDKEGEKILTLSSPPLTMSSYSNVFSYPNSSDWKTIHSTTLLLWY